MYTNDGSITTRTVRKAPLFLSDPLTLYNYLLCGKLPPGMHNNVRISEIRELLQGEELNTQLDVDTLFDLIREILEIEQVSTQKADQLQEDMPTVDSKNLFQITTFEDLVIATRSDSDTVEGLVRELYDDFNSQQISFLATIDSVNQYLEILVQHRKDFAEQHGDNNQVFDNIITTDFFKDAIHVPLSYNLPEVIPAMELEHALKHITYTNDFVNQDLELNIRNLELILEVVRCVNIDKEHNSRVHAGHIQSLASYAQILPLDVHLLKLLSTYHKADLVLSEQHIEQQISLTDGIMHRMLPAEVATEAIRRKTLREQRDTCEADYSQATEDIIVLLHELASAESSLSDSVSRPALYAHSDKHSPDIEDFTLAQERASVSIFNYIRVPAEILAGYNREVQVQTNPEDFADYNIYLSNPLHHVGVKEGTESEGILQL